ncbi:MAG: hypothetical protein M0R80_26895 [Proteobacteria bacterium]|jgi:hypothetical protein|nr:hypothetical protein [Pseudomonadota bacterium]
MKRAVRVLAVIDIVLALVIAALLLFSDGAREQFRRLFDSGNDNGAAVAARRGVSEDEGGSRASGEKGAAPKGKKGGASSIDKVALQAMLKAGRVNEAEVERRVAEIIETRKRTIEVKRAEEERRIGEVADWFDHLMAHHPESGAKAREIMNEYIDLRYATYGDMEDVDPEFARAQRESIRQRVGQRLMSELPPAQGATVLKQLFI